MHRIPCSNEGVLHIHGIPVVRMSQHVETKTNIFAFVLDNFVRLLLPL
jgi:hypothetical protein